MLNKSEHMITHIKVIASAMEAAQKQRDPVDILLEPLDLKAAMWRRPRQVSTLCASSEHQLAGADVHQQVFFSPVALVMKPMKHNGKVQSHGGWTGSGLPNCGPEGS